MKIVNKTEFYLLPKGVLYSDYEPCFISALKIKGNTIYHENKPVDFFYENLIGNVKADSSNDFVDILNQALENKTSFNLDFESSIRDGLFEEEQFFVIYEKKDLEDLITKLKSLLDLCQ